MSELEKHLGIGEPIKIGEDEINLKPLGVEDLPSFFKLMRVMTKVKKGEMSDEEYSVSIFGSMDDECLNALSTLIKKTIDISFPDEKEEVRNQFGMKYMMPLLMKIMELNMQGVESKGSEIGRKVEAIRKIQEKKKAIEESQKNK